MTSSQEPPKKIAKMCAINEGEECEGECLEPAWLDIAPMWVRKFFKICEQGKFDVEKFCNSSSGGDFTFIDIEADRVQGDIEKITKSLEDTKLTLGGMNYKS